jgi:hypothetical protein
MRAGVQKACDLSYLFEVISLVARGPVTHLLIMREDDRDAIPVSGVLVASPRDHTHIYYTCFVVDG